MALGKILRTHQVLEVTGLTRATLYRYIAAGTFPQPIHLGPQSRGWEEEAVATWRAARERGVDSPAGRRLRAIPRDSAA
jgi:prophage regulatory protein